uniref:hypothetical protein n=1 Tax=Desertihabitans aurantiacus TaxID=2282477 RepID=UPI00130030F2
MDAGLHLALAAWVHARSGGQGFLACPELPVPLQLVDLSAPGSMTDLGRAWEFAQLTNGDVRRGQPARSAAVHPPLWVRHRQLLQRMQFATRSWSAAEEDQLRAARAVLFSDGPGGFPVPSPAFTLYQEYRSVHDDLQAQGAPPEELTALLAEWLVVGHKAAVEAALSTVSRLASRSTLPTAERQRLMLADELLPASADGSYAATTFTPLSAVDPGTWLAARVSLDDLDAALPGDLPRAAWDGWRTNRRGHLDLRFVALELHRAWFSAEQYAASDWRVPDGVSASAGDGVHGEVPAHAVRAYLVEVTGSALPGRTVDPPPAPDPYRPADRLRVRA